MTTEFQKKVIYSFKKAKADILNLWNTVYDLRNQQVYIKDKMEYIETVDREPMELQDIKIKLLEFERRLMKIEELMEEKVYKNVLL